MRKMIHLCTIRGFNQLSISVCDFYSPVFGNDGVCFAAFSGGRRKSTYCFESNGGIYKASASFEYVLWSRGGHLRLLAVQGGTPQKAKHLEGSQAGPDDTQVRQRERHGTSSSIWRPCVLDEEHGGDAPRRSRVSLVSFAQFCSGRVQGALPLPG